MSCWALEGVGHPHRIELGSWGTIVIGRAADADVIVPDATVSRRHAEVRVTDRGVEIADLKSSNGTAVNGGRIADAVLAPGDIVQFGKIRYRLTTGEETERPTPGTEPTPDGTIVRRIDLGPAALSLALAPGLEANQQAHQLARLVDLARRLSGEFESDKLISQVVELTFDLLPVDRVSLLLFDPDAGELVPALSKSRLGDPASVRVPRSIGRRAVADRTPIVTENAVADERFKSGSVMVQSVRGAICTPLLASRDHVLGVLYADTLTATRPFTEDEATLLHAFAGLAAVSLGKLRLAEEIQREAQVRTNFERFFAPNIAARIARQTGAIQLGGDRRTVTVLFTDIRGFTAIAETIPPDQLSRWLTEYFTEMVDLVFEHGGTLDKFIGDAIMAVWGAPLPAADDADRAVAAALAMQARLSVLNARWAVHGRPELPVGIGLGQGEVFAGYLGSERRLEYSVIGDPVNVAARLCDEAKAGEVLLTDEVAQSLTRPVALERVEGIELKGRRRPVGVWRAFGPRAQR
jgi:adenylate cyclase